MLYRDIFRTLAFFLWIFLIPLMVPFLISIYYDYWVQVPTPHATWAFFWTLVVCAFLGLIFWLIGRKGSGKLYRREALLLVLIVYFFTPLIGSLPFSFSKVLTNPVNAYFEAVSALTTTGASVMEPKVYDETGKELPIERIFLIGEAKNYSYYGTIKPVYDSKSEKWLSGIDAVSPALIFWRSFMSWLGGGGVVVLFVAILPALGVGGKMLFQTETSGPSKESMLPRIKETASQLWKIYLGLTLLEVFFLLITNHKMTFFEALVISFSTLSTGGFSPKSSGIAGYHNAYTDWVLIVFMILGSISFSIYFFLMRRKFSRLNDPEMKIFLLIILCASLFATWQLYGKSKEPSMGIPGAYSFSEALRHGTFQVVSAQTTTGFYTANYDLWPFPIQMLMLILMFVGGMAGSTAGGIKVVRYETFFHILLNKIESIYRPDTVRTYRLGNTIIDNRSATTILSFFMVSASLVILGTFLLVLDGIDPETSLTTMSSMINNTGFAFRMAGPTESFAFLSNFGKILSSFWMIAGRLEFFAVLIVFVPAFWRPQY